MRKNAQNYVIGILDNELQQIVSYTYVLTGTFAGNNLYAYCGNNPVNMYDPDGYEPIALGISVIKILTVVVLIPVIAKSIEAVIKFVDLIAEHINDGESAATASNDTSVVTPTVTTAVVDPNSNNSNDDEFDERLNKKTNSSAKQKSKKSMVTNDIINKQRVNSALKNDSYHAFPDIVDNYAGFADKFKIPNGNLYQLKG